MIGPMRWIDTGLGAARFNVAMTAGLCALHRAGRIGDTLRFHRYPPSVLIGRHQMLGREVRVEHCRRHQIEVARRVTGGGAVYMSPGILAWDIVAQRRCFAGDLDEIVALICTAMAAGLTPLGLSARFRRSNDVVIEGRKISGCSGSFEGATVLLQGTVLIDVDLAEMTEALILPMPAGKTATLRLLAERLTSLARALGTPPPLADVTHALVAGLSHALGREVKNAAVGGEEITLAERLLADEIGTRSFVEGEGPDRPGVAHHVRQRTASGFVEAYLRLREGIDRRIDQIWITGEFLARPASAIPDLEAALRGVPIAAAAARASALLASSAVEIRGATQEDIVAVLVAAEASTRAVGARAP